MLPYRRKKRPQHSKTRLLRLAESYANPENTSEFTTWNKVTCAANGIPAATLTAAEAAMLIGNLGVQPLAQQGLMILPTIFTQLPAGMILIPLATLGGLTYYFYKTGKEPIDAALIKEQIRRSKIGELLLWNRALSLEISEYQSLLATKTPREIQEAKRLGREFNFQLEKRRRARIRQKWLDAQDELNRLRHSMQGNDILRARLRVVTLSKKFRNDYEKLIDENRHPHKSSARKIGEIIYYALPVFLGVAFSVIGFVVSPLALGYTLATIFSSSTVPALAWGLIASSTLGITMAGTTIYTQKKLSAKKARIEEHLEEMKVKGKQVLKDNIIEQLREAGFSERSITGLAPASRLKMDMAELKELNPYLAKQIASEKESLVRLKKEKILCAIWGTIIGSLSALCVGAIIFSILAAIGVGGPILAIGMGIGALLAIPVSIVLYKLKKNEALQFSEILIKKIKNIFNLFTGANQNANQQKKISSAITATITVILVVLAAVTLASLPPVSLTVGTMIGIAFIGAFLGLVAGGIEAYLKYRTENRHEFLEKVRTIAEETAAEKSAANQYVPQFNHNHQHSHTQQNGASYRNDIRWGFFYHRNYEPEVSHYQQHPHNRQNGSFSGNNGGGGFLRHRNPHRYEQGVEMDEFSPPVAQY